MNEPPDSEQIRHLFEKASELDGLSRETYLDEVCAERPELRAELESLLEAIEDAGDFLKDPAIDSYEAFTAAVELNEGDIIGEYRLLEKIGEGSNAVVYMVEQIETLRRRAAMKVIKLGMDTREVIARFEVERQALALMDHPNIAKVFDAGTTGTGRPYFIMELVKGVPITDYCDRNNLPTTERLELFLQVCLALQHAHLKGIIHRDVKPSNILVTLHDGTPVPKVIDFGIAKATESRLTDKTLFTRFHQFIGTPAYMSPEQAEMSGLDIDTRSDIYSLGVLLYELLTGSTPFDGKELLESGYAGIQRVIREQEPDWPSTRLSTLGAEGLTSVSRNRQIEPGALSKDIKGDLDWIVMKALEKDRTHRYETATEFARDIRRHLDDQPVDAAPRGKAYYIGKFVRRHRSMVIAGSAVVLSMIAGTVVATILWQRSLREAAEAKRQAERATGVTQLLDTMFESAGPDAAKGSDFTVRQLLNDFSRDFAGRLNLDPEVEVTVRQTISTAYEGLGEYVQAEPHARRAHELSVQIFGEQSLNSMRTLSQLGWLSYQLGNRKDGLRFIKQAEVYQEKHLDLNHPDYLHTLCCLASIYLDNGELNLAGDTSEKAFEATKPLPGEQPSPSHLWIARTLAQVYQARGRTQDAEQLFNSLLASSPALPDTGDQHPRTIEAMHTVCLIRIKQGELDQATELAQRAKETAIRTLGEDHRTTLLLQGDLALISQERGDLELAYRSFQQLLGRQRALLGDQHQDTIETILALASLQQARRKQSASSQHAMEAYSLANGTFGPRKPITIESLGQLAQSVADQGRFFEAQEIFDKAHILARESLGENHETTLQCALRLARFEMIRGQNDRADQLYQGIIERRRSAQGDDGDQTLDCRQEYVVFLKETGHYAKALAEARELAERRRRNRGASSAKTIFAIRELSAIERLRGVEMNAEEHINEAFELSRQHLGAQHPTTLEIMHEQSEISRLLGRNERAASILATALPIAIESLGETASLTSIIREELADVRHMLEEQPTKAKRAQDAYQNALSVHGPESLNSFNELNRLIEILSATPGAREECERLVEENIEQSRLLFGDQHVQHMRALHLRARTSQESGQDELAHRYYRDVMDAQREAGMLTHQRSLTTLYTWSEFLIQRGRQSEADTLLDQWQDEIHRTSWSPERIKVLIPRRGAWHFRRYLKHQSNDWRTMGRDELPTSWHEGLAPFGYGIRGIGTMPLIDGDKRSYFTTCFHREFVVDDPSSIRSLKLRLRREDGAAVFINGKGVARSNLHETAVGGTSAVSNAYAIARNLHYTYIIPPGSLKKGRNIIAAELHQTGFVGSHMVFDLELQALASREEPPSPPAQK